MAAQRVINASDDDDAVISEYVNADDLWNSLRSEVKLEISVIMEEVS